MILNTLSFELRIMVRKRRMNLEQHKKGVRRKLYFNVPAQEARGGQPLAPILGQLQVNPGEFCLQFNAKTKDLPKGMLTFVELLVNWDKTFIINFIPLPISVFIQEFLYVPICYLELKQDLKLIELNKESRFTMAPCIGVSDVYKLALIYQQITGVANIKFCLSTIYSCLLSYKINISQYTQNEYLEYIAFILQRCSEIFILLEHNIKGFGVFNFHLEASYALLSSSFDPQSVENESKDVFFSLSQFSREEF